MSFSCLKMKLFFPPFLCILSTKNNLVYTYVFICGLFWGCQICMEACETNNRPHRKETNYSFHHSRTKSRSIHNTIAETTHIDIHRLSTVFFFSVSKENAAHNSFKINSKNWKKKITVESFTIKKKWEYKLDWLCSTERKRETKKALTTSKANFYFI